MAGNSTSSSGLVTVTPEQSSGPRPETVVLAVCLPLLAFVVLVPLVGYIIHRKLKHISLSERLPKMEGARQQAPDSHYIAAPALVTPSTVQNPIYENVHRGFQDLSPKRQYNPAPSVTPSRHDSDPYMNHDVADEAVYSNDPSFQCGYNIEDDYVVPDTL